MTTEATALDGEATGNTAADPPPSLATSAPARAYVVPMLVFLGLTFLEGYLPKVDGQTVPLWYAGAYAFKVVLVSVCLWIYRTAWRDLRPLPSAGVLALSAALGLAVAFGWVGLDPYYPRFGLLGTRTAFDPATLPTGWREGFLVSRLVGLVLVVPLLEELFWRSFLVRWVIDQDFQRVAIGRVTPLAAAVTTGLFTLAHPEWLPALLTGLAWTWLLWHTKSVSACLVSHMAANLGLGVYVLCAHQWIFW